MDQPTIEGELKRLTKMLVTLGQMGVASSIRRRQKAGNRPSARGCESACSRRTDEDDSDEPATSRTETGGRGRARAACARVSASWLAGSSLAITSARPRLSR
jgi:hypothetical protein